mmetsp:Transcript_17895/g.54734  ORF Transcript_17895/g.54734 Transcript_17895/m.54734 type:complete len:288 (+) Transcript_17895:89-952(+)
MAEFQRTRHAHYRHPSQVVLAPPPYQVMAQQDVVMEAPGGVSNVGLHLYETGAYVHVGICVSANCGCPLGGCGLSNGTVTALHANHRNPEEDVVSNWLLTETHEGEATPNAVYQRTTFRRWGMTNVEGADVATIQGVDYTEANPEDYGDAYIVLGCRLSEVAGMGLERRFVRGHSFPCSLVFAFAPNVNYSPKWRRSSVLRRTYNGSMTRYERFLEAVAFAYMSALAALAASSCDLAVLGAVGVGDNAGPHRVRIREDLPAVVANLLAGSLGPPFGLYFKRVVLVLG